MSQTSAPRASTVAKALLGVAALVLATLAGASTAQAGDHHRHDGHGHHRTWTVLVGNQSRNLALQGMRFLPGSITVNEGDTVTWVAGSVEIHTVTLLDGGRAQKTLPAFDPGDLAQLTRQGGDRVEGSGTFSSGLMTTVPTGEDVGPIPPVPHVQRYSLTFPHDGTYTYYCLVHGIMMVGTVTVQEEDAAYPYTQDEYDAQARKEAAAILAQGRELRRQTRQASDAHHVSMGADDGTVAVMRFLPGTSRIHVGDKVRFDNTGLGAPHTVTFGTEPPPPDLFAPSGDPSHYAGGDLNSGIVTPGGHFTVRFTKPGRYPYVCALHDVMGMVGTVVVRR